MDDRRLAELEHTHGAGFRRAAVAGGEAKVLEADVGGGDLRDQPGADQQVGADRAGGAGQEAAGAAALANHFPNQLHRVVVHVHAAHREEAGAFGHQLRDGGRRGCDHRGQRAPTSGAAGTFANSVPHLPQKTNSAGIPLAPQVSQVPV